MHVKQHLPPARSKYVFASVLLVLIALVTVAFNMDRDGFDMSRREILLRRIGHELLLQSGDSTSRVLPIKKISGNEYQISFDKELTFEPQALVNTTRRVLTQDSHARDYVVNVMNCGNSTVAYGYAISNDQKDDIVSCIGRTQPRACYLINIRFKSAGINTTNKLILGGLPLLALLGFVFLRFAKPKKVSPEVEVQVAGTFTLGSVLFDSESRKLIINGITTELTNTETRVLMIFASSPNETIERARLQKEIWEDEGVIVGRSLDMFISKLRKKLEPDPQVKIVVVRGKGYRLEIG